MIVVRCEVLRFPDGTVPGNGRKSVKGLDRPRVKAVLGCHGNEGGLARGISPQSLFQVELPAIDLGETLSLQTRLVSEVEKGQAVGGQGLRSPPSRPWEKDQSRRKVAEGTATDLGTQSSGVVWAMILQGCADLVQKTAVTTLGQSVGAP
jgi:hypothetical protein